MNEKITENYDYIICHPPCRRNTEEAKIWKEHILKNLSNKGKACMLIPCHSYNQINKSQTFDAELVIINKNIEEIEEKNLIIHHKISTSIISINFANHEEIAYVSYRN